MEHSYHVILFSIIELQIGYICVNAVNFSGFLVLELFYVGPETDLAAGFTFVAH